MAKKETKKEAFKRIASNRTDKIIKQIDSFNNFTNKSFYEYSVKDINELCDCIISKVKSVRENLLKEV